MTRERTRTSQHSVCHRVYGFRSVQPFDTWCSVSCADPDGGIQLAHLPWEFVSGCAREW
eukprot:EC793982.1.p5 GENE.EC793982.1~~EC793982.1.p5  ORF type:complete len:59 (+),score=2.27 EC793982.1:434-610(+)